MLLRILILIFIFILSLGKEVWILYNVLSHFEHSLVLVHACTHFV